MPLFPFHFVLQFVSVLPIYRLMFSLYFLLIDLIMWMSFPAFLFGLILKDFR